MSILWWWFGRHANLALTTGPAVVLACAAIAEAAIVASGADEYRRFATLNSAFEDVFVGVEGYFFGLGGEE
jgi:hypothetical protein